MPKTDDADIYVQEIAECYSMVLAEKHIEVTADSVFERLHIWCARWAPDFPVNLMRATARQAAAQAGRLSGSELVGQRLRLSHKERSELKIVTIGSYDVDRKTRKRLARDRKRKRDRDRAAQKRALEGRQSREEYLAAHRASRDQPWITLGISRRTYYRRQKKLWLTTGSDFEHVRSVPLIEDALLKDGRPGSQSIMRGSHCERALERSELGGCQ
ncbi:hypothetical protein IVB08_00330 [Bradyrhizobium sp. 173]|uniref:hypothetical protein n=1 Tax=Bradyrhizobium sp. 173 TaxID=2782644 RepID=UPI001FF90960|nr:hypothetical protein [Bradyrhizobium sp. 173]MCK1562457.1 hypothetical protein [Bradyrhizobium sp. 173]